MTPETVAPKILAPLLFTLFKHERGALVCMVVLRFISWNLPSRMFWSRGKINWSLWIDWRHQGKCFGVRALVHMCVWVCSSVREKETGGLFRRSGPRSSYWVQTARLLHRLGSGPPGSQRKVPFLVPLKLNWGHRPCNLETQLLIYQHTNYIRYSLSPCRPFERPHCEAERPLAC